jgi:hypothetical protein
MWPPTVDHTTPTHCHAKGTCVDVGFISDSDYNLETIDDFMTAAKAVGFRPVFEEDSNGDPTSSTLVSAVRERGHEAACLSIFGDHFSFY